jgi:acetyl-CoA acetyltransferase family protein
MPAAVIVDALRTAVGKRNGGLSGWHPVDLAGATLSALVERNDLDPHLIDDVIMGCVMQVGAQSVNIGRNAVLAAGLPESVPAATIDRQCGSSQQAIHFAAQGVMAGAYDIVIAAGVEVMSLVPLGASAMVPAVGLPFGPAMMRRYAPEGGLVPQGISAELIAERWGLTRDDLDAYAVRSHARAEAAAEHGRFAAEILPVPGKRRDRETGAIIEAKKPVRRDEGIRKGTTVEALGKLKAAFQAGGQVTAGNSSQISDGAAALLIMSEARAAELGYTPRARFHAFALAGVDPISMLTAPIPATTRVLERAKLALDDLDVVEINEAFASVVLAWQRELHPDMDKVNVNGGAIALGHPLGATGTRLTTTLLCELERTGGRFGLQTMCEGGGMANATIIERLG